jgi:hypothetical protein
VANYVRESILQKQSLFESAYSFDIDKAIVENWKWVEGNKTFSDKLSGNFDKAIGQISGDAPTTDAEAKPETPTTEPNSGEGEISFDAAMAMTKDDTTLGQRQTNIAKGGEYGVTLKGQSDQVNKAVYKQMKSGPTADEVATTLKTSKGGWLGQDNEAWVQSAFESIRDKQMYDEVAQQLGSDPYEWAKSFMSTSELSTSMHTQGKTIDGEYARITGSGNEPAEGESTEGTEDNG